MSETIDWEEIKFRASSWGNLLTESRDKKGLGQVAQKELIKIYNLVKYGRKKDITTKQMDKGNLCQPEAISMLCKVDKVLYKDNTEQLENEWFCGKPDIFLGESVQAAESIHDIKCSWSLDTFMPQLVEADDKGYIAQLNCYFDLTGAQSGSIDYCLVSAPMSIILQEKKSLLWKMDVATDLNPDYLEAAEELEHLMVFEDIDPRERIIRKKVVRDDELIQKMKDKVPVFREWLADFEKKHMNLYPKS